MKQILGVIRPDTNGNWFLLDDTYHEPLGLVSVAQNANYVEVTFDATLSKVYSAATNPDETLALNDIAVGTSIDLDKMRIYFVKSGSHVNPNTIKNQWANVWIAVWGEE